VGQEAFNELIHIPTLVVLARLLSPYEFGITAAAGFFVSFANRFTKFGFNVALVRMKHVEPEHSSSVFVVSLAMGLVSWAALTFGSPWLGRFFDSPEAGQVLPIAAFTFVIAAVGTVPSAMMTRDMRYKAKTVVDWSGTVTHSIVAVALAWNGWSYWSLVYAELARATVLTTAYLGLGHWRPSLRFSSTAMREMLSFGIGIYAKRLLDYGTQNLDNLVVGRVLGLTALGLYDKAFNTVNKIASRLTLNGPNVTFRIFALIHEDRERFRRAYRKVILTSTLLSYPALATLIVVAPPLFLILFGDKWLSAVAPFQILCVAAMPKMLNAFASTAVQAIGQVWSEVWRQLVSILLLVVAVAAFSRWGIEGAAAGVLVATLAQSVLMYGLLGTTSGLTPRDVWAPQVPSLLCAAGAATLAVLAGQALRLIEPAPRPWVLLLAQTSVAIAFFVGFVFRCGFTDVRALVREVMSDVAPRLARTVKLPA
jgi:O-antigen/teichoic acid export membrane protein